MTATILATTSLDLRETPVSTPRPATFPVAYPAVRPDALADTDLSFLIDLLSDPTVAWYEPLPIALPDPGAVQLVRRFLQKVAAPDASTLAWSVVEAGHRVGVCQLRRDGDGFLLGVSLSAGVRSRGLGTALFRALALHGVYDLGASHVAGEAEDDNVASVRALAKAAYTPVDRYVKTLDNGREATVTRFTSLIAPGQ